MATKTLEIWLIVDADGYTEVGTSESEALERYDENVGDNGSRRVIKLSCKVALPTNPIVEVDVPDDAGEVIQAEAAE